MGSEAKLQRYYDWLMRCGRDIEILKLSYLADNLGQLKDCAGVVLTGGGDVDPRLYGGDPKHPKVLGVDPKRDDFERTVIDSAVRQKIPLLGICRGLQIVNVHLGGTLIVDLPESGHAGHTGNPETDVRHGVTLKAASVIHREKQSVHGEVNSYHHQAADQPGAGLCFTALSADGVAEAIEPVPGAIPSFFLLVQWHPERMADVENPMCTSVRNSFITASAEHDIKNQ
jgi:putative glutamine amidotransferase